ncbi:peptidoglycan-binding protein [Hyphobacterium sp.]|uniref:peptidoglycan-binding protein n=1 Tax=Hyphobacterium sp. TaxID=2004662 RepID=UPI003748FE32
MSSAGPWSVKGIDPRARARAKTAARREGMTLGEWLNTVILDGGPDRDGEPRWESNLESYPGFASRSDEGDALLRGMVERLTERIESTEQHSASFLNEVDRSLSDLAERVEATDQTWRQDQQKTRDLAEAARSAAEALALRVKRIEDAGGTADPQTLKTFESAFGKLAQRVFRNENDSLRSAEIMQSALDEFGQATEAATVSLQKRIESIEAGQSRLSEDLRKTASRSHDTGQVLHGLHNAADRLRRRVEDTERLTNDAASAFEQSVARIDARLRSLESRPFSADNGDLDRRFDLLSDELARVVADTRAQVARELEDAVSEPRVERLERALKSAETRIAAAETSHSESLSRIGLEITRLARVMDDRISESEKKAEALHNTDKADRELAQRFDAVRNENREAIQKLGEDVSALGRSLGERVEKSESRAAEAIETATKSMSEAVARLEERQAAKSQESDLEDRLRQSEERTAKRIEEAISGISGKLEQARAEAEESLSPVQRAMNALADRLEAIENRAVAEEPAVEEAPAPEPTPAPAMRQTAYSEPDFSTPLPPPPDAETPPGYDDDEVDDPFIIAEAATPPSRNTVREPEEPDEFLIDEQALEQELADTGQQRQRGPSADAGMILQPMAPVDEPVRRQRPRQQQAEAPRPKPRAPLGATADADFLAAARSRTRGDRSASFDPYVTEEEEGGNGLKVLIAASVLGFVAITAVAGLLVFERLDGEPASTAEALSADILGEGTSDLTIGIASGDAADTSQPAITPPPAADTNAAEASAAETASVAPEQTVTPNAAPQTAAPVETTPPPAAEAETSVASEPVVVTLPTLQQAAASGDPVARYLLGEERLSSGDVAGAAALIRRAAEQNVPAAQYRYAKLLERGEGVDQDLAAARQWTRRAADAGHRRAMHNLGVKYATGSGGEENLEEAFRWFEEAALRGLTDSQYNLAVLFQQGQGTEQSPGDAYAWFSIAAAGGDTGAGQQAAAIAGTLSADILSQANAIVASFTPRPFDAEANGQYNRNWGATITLDPGLIASAQSLLNGLGYDAGVADGQLGPRTETAVRAFQTDRGLPPTGIIDPALIGRLENARSG